MTINTQFGIFDGPIPCRLEGKTMQFNSFKDASDYLNTMPEAGAYMIIQVPCGNKVKWEIVVAWLAG